MTKNNIIPSDININLDSKAIRKLISVTASGVGAVAGSWLTRKNAKAEADSIRLLAQAQRDASDIANGKKAVDKNGEIVTINHNEVITNENSEIQVRLDFQESKRQKNLEDIVHQAALELPETVSDDPVDEDWISKFFTYAQDISSEDMKTIWSKILAGEIAKPGTTSQRTLEHIKNLTKEEAHLFEKIKPFLIDDFFISSLTDDGKYGLTFQNIMDLQQAGLLIQQFGLQKQFKSLIPNSFMTFIHFNKFERCQITREAHDSIISLNAVILTQAGKEILEITGQQDLNKQYYKDIFLKEIDGYDVKFADVRNMIVA